MVATNVVLFSIYSSSGPDTKEACGLTCAQSLNSMDTAPLGLKYTEQASELRPTGQLQALYRTQEQGSLHCVPTSQKENEGARKSLQVKPLSV